MENKIRTLLVDDESNSLKMLRGYLNEYTEEVQVVATADSAQKGVEMILKHRPELIFLDIAMPEQNGIQMLEHFRERTFEVVFVTAYEDFSLDAFDMGAVHYLLKPVSLVKLKEAVQRTYDKIKAPGANLVAHGHKAKPVMLRISETKFHRMVKIADIAYLMGDRSYTTIIMKDGEQYTASNNIKYFEDQLTDHGFFRIHKQYLVNLQRVCYITRGKGGYVYLDIGVSLEISYRKKSEFIEQLDQHGIIT